MKGISMPWKRAIFVAMAADNTGSRSSWVFSGRLCTQEPIRVVKADIGKGDRGWGSQGRAGLILGCTVPAGPPERLRRAGGPAPALQEWRTSHFQGPRSPRPERRCTAKGSQSQGQQQSGAVTPGTFSLLLPSQLGLRVLLPRGSGARAFLP